RGTISPLAIASVPAITGFSALQLPFSSCAKKFTDRRSGAISGVPFKPLRCSPRLRLAYLSAAGLGLLPPYSASLFRTSRKFDDLFGHGPRITGLGRIHQFLALSARTAGRLCDIRRL